MRHLTDTEREDLADLEQLQQRNSDNPGLSANARSRPRRTKRARRDREAKEMAQMVTRVSRAMVRRAATGDLEALIALRQMRDDIAEATRHAARELHSPTSWAGEGYSWTVIGQELGISRQAARQQFSD